VQRRRLIGRTTDATECDPVKGTISIPLKTQNDIVALITKLMKKSRGPATRQANLFIVIGLFFERSGSTDFISLLSLQFLEMHRHQALSKLSGIRTNANVRVSSIPSF
ncbi:MAG: hypothetical protein K0U90_11165, partial [Planctomycetes bacterium]|nr:hypothetical protein [Planctomycetota bacterium]